MIGRPLALRLACIDKRSRTILGRPGHDSRRGAADRVERADRNEQKGRARAEDARLVSVETDVLKFKAQTCGDLHRGRRFVFKPLGQLRQLEISGKRLALATARDADDVADRLLKHNSEILSGEQIARAPVRDERRRSNRRVAGEGQFALRRKNPHTRAIDGVPRLEDEHGLGQVKLGGDRLHACVVEPFGVENHGERIASQRRLGEHIERLKPARHPSPVPRATPLACGRVSLIHLQPGPTQARRGDDDQRPVRFRERHIVRQPIDAADALNCLLVGRTLSLRLA